MNESELSELAGVLHDRIPRLKSETQGDWESHLRRFGLAAARKILGEFFTGFALDRPPRPGDLGKWLRQYPDRVRHIVGPQSPWHFGTEVEVLAWPRCSMIRIRYEQRGRPLTVYGWIERQEGLGDRLFAWRFAEGRFYRTVVGRIPHGAKVRILPREAPTSWPFGPDATEAPEGLADLLEVEIGVGAGF